MTDRQDRLTDEESKGYRYGKSGSYTVLEEYDVEAEGWYTMATLHEPDENRTGERLVEALTDKKHIRALERLVKETNRLLTELNAARGPSCIMPSCPNPPYTKSGHCHHHRYLRYD
ncbi:hypothetical protein LCGC14_2187530 [marine sediment metagenome]|uniref:Uncharacterized protein n=1 Tax=marine sediment metagenome TaxID=412755 RepID=A0A0F9FXW9_9ZZZZ